MTEQQEKRDWWALPACLAWCALLTAGLFPEATFLVFREWGGVSVFRAMINNPWFVSLSCASFLGVFTFRRCRECDDPQNLAFGKSLQVVILALAAFLPMQLENLPLYFLIPDATHKHLLIGMSAVKLLTWAYLALLILRYYLGAGYAVFKDMPLIFPSARQQEKTSSPPGIPHNPSP